jgi:hypothetical protein
LDGDKPPLDKALRDLAARARRDLGPHPTPEQLAAYHAGELPDDEVERIQDHLVLCHECSELLLDLADFENPEAPAEVPGLTDADVDAAWQDLKARMAGQSAPQRPTAPVEIAVPTQLGEPVPNPPPENVLPLQRRDPRGPSWKVGYGLAAMFAIALVGLSIWTTSLYRDYRQADKPQVLTSITLGETTRGGDSENELPADWTEAKVRLRWPGEKAEPVRLQIAERDTGRVLWTSSPFRAQSNIEFSLKRSFLKPGEYLVRVLRAEGDELLKDFPLKIEE